MLEEGLEVKTVVSDVGSLVEGVAVDLFKLEIQGLNLFEEESVVWMHSYLVVGRLHLDRGF